MSMLDNAVVSSIQITASDDHVGAVFQLRQTATRGRLTVLEDGTPVLNVDGTVKTEKHPQAGTVPPVTVE